jgi:hypothetical protein
LLRGDDEGAVSLPRNHRSTLCRALPNESMRPETLIYIDLYNTLRQTSAHLKSTLTILIIGQERKCVQYFSHFAQFYLNVEIPISRVETKFIQTRNVSCSIRPPQ